MTTDNSMSNPPSVISADPAASKTCLAAVWGTPAGSAPFGHAKSRGGLAMSLLCCWAPSAATLHPRERKLKLQTGKCLVWRGFRSERDRPRVCYGARDSSTLGCLSPRPALWVKHTLSFISEEMQRPAVKQQAFPKTAFCNAAGMKHQYFFQRVSFTKTIQTQPPPQTRKAQPG